MSGEIIQSRAIREAIAKGNEAFKMLQVPGERMNPIEEEENTRKVVGQLHRSCMIDMSDRCQ